MAAYGSSDVRSVYCDRISGILQAILDIHQDNSHLVLMCCFRSVTINAIQTLALTGTLLPIGYFCDLESRISVSIDVTRFLSNLHKPAIFLDINRIVAYGSGQVVDDIVPCIGGVVVELIVFITLSILDMHIQMAYQFFKHF